MWEPSPERRARTNLTRFMADHGGDYTELYRWSIRDPEAFWVAVWEFCEIRAERRWDTVLADPEQMPGARWFVGSELNFAANLLRFRDARPAIVFRGEDGRRTELSYAELYRQVARVAAGLRELGIRPGDRVAGFMPNIPETVIAMLAATSLGAVWSSCSPDFGSNGVVDRFGQISPRVLFTADGYLYNGRANNSLQRIAGVISRLPDVERVVVVPFLAESPELEGVESAVLWEDFLGDDE